MFWMAVKDLPRTGANAFAPPTEATARTCRTPSDREMPCARVPGGSSMKVELLESLIRKLANEVEVVPTGNYGDWGYPARAWGLEGTGGLAALLTEQEQAFAAAIARAKLLAP